MAKDITNTAASVHAQLLNQARAGSRSFNDLLQLYAMERFLHWLSRTRYADQSVLKGALLMRAWDTSMRRDGPVRPRCALKTACICTTRSTSRPHQQPRRALQGLDKRFSTFCGQGRQDRG